MCVPQSDVLKALSVFKSCLNKNHIILHECNKRARLVDMKVTILQPQLYKQDGALCCTLLVTFSFCHIHTFIK